MPRYEIRNDRLVIEGQPAAFRQARDVGGRIKPTLIVLHDTAGGLNAEGSISWLAGNPGKTSAHFVVARDGKITQLADADRKCNHAGKSVWRGRELCNGFSIGIEIVNPGKLLKRGEASAVSSVGQVFERAEFGIGCCTSPAHGGEGWWMPYTAEQLTAVESLVAALTLAYPTITEVVGHHDISPGRKVDPTPLMDWPRMRRALASARQDRPQPATVAAPAVDIAAVQVRLAALGYYTGLADGVLGTRTEAAVFAFQKENALATTGKLDAGTVSAIADPAAKPLPTGHREEATEASLAAAGSQTIAAAADMRSISVWQALLAGVLAIMTAVKEIISVAGLEIAIIALLGLVGWFAFRGLDLGRFLRDHRLEEHRQGVK